MKASQNLARHTIEERPEDDVEMDEKNHLPDQNGPVFMASGRSMIAPMIDTNGDVSPMDVNDNIPLNHPCDNEGNTFVQFARKFSSKHMANVLSTANTTFKHMKAFQDSAGGGPHMPLADEEEWELVKWLIHNVNQWATEESLKLPIMCKHLQFYRK